MENFSYSITEHVCNVVAMIVTYCLKPLTQLSYALKTIGHSSQVNIINYMLQTNLNQSLRYGKNQL